MKIHRIDPALVRQSVEDKCAEHARNRVSLIKRTLEALAKHERDGGKYWVSKPDPAHIGPMYDEWVAKEREHYARVRVVERCGGFTLKYGVDPDDEPGTGPFKTLEDATDWFVGGGR